MSYKNLCSQPLFNSIHSLSTYVLTRPAHVTYDGPPFPVHIFRLTNYGEALGFLGTREYTIMPEIFLLSPHIHLTHDFLINNKSPFIEGTIL